MFAITPNILSNFMNSLSRYVILLSLILICVSIFLIIFLENDYYQGISFKIMFIHVPTAWLSLAIFLIMGPLPDLSREERQPDGSIRVLP